VQRAGEKKKGEGRLIDLCQSGSIKLPPVLGASQTGNQKWDFQATFFKEG